MIVGIISYQILSIVIKNAIYILMKNHKGVIIFFIKLAFKTTGKLCKKIGITQSED